MRPPTLTIVLVKDQFIVKQLQERLGAEYYVMLSNSGKDSIEFFQVPLN